MIICNHDDIPVLFIMLFILTFEAWPCITKIPDVFSTLSFFSLHLHHQTIGGYVSHNLLGFPHTLGYSKENSHPLTILNTT